MQHHPQITLGNVQRRANFLARHSFHLPQHEHGGHLIAPDYPGFGHSSWPAPESYAYTFDHLAHTMQAFADALRLERYALFLQDYGGLDGFETCRRLKANADTSHLPVLFMTALIDTAARLAGFAAGAVDYISKPFEPEEVLARLRVQVELQRLRRALEAEVRLHQNAEAQLERSLSQAVLVADAEGRLVFCARSARELLARYLKGFDPEAPLPAALLEGQPIPRASGPVRLRARRFAAEAGRGRDEQGVTVLLLREEAPEPSLMLMSALDLTEREAEVLYWVAQGKTSPEISIILGMALKTVRKHLQRVYRKLGVETRASAAVQASEILNRHALPWPNNSPARIGAEDGT